MSELVTVTNSDDFLIRYLKGCIQLSCAPVIDNGINMVPVNHVARCVVACSLFPTTQKSGIAVAQVTAKPRMTFTAYAALLGTYGYDVRSVGYGEWKERLVRYVEEGGAEREEHALMPLFHFVTGLSPFLLLSIDVSTSFWLPLFLLSKYLINHPYQSLS